MKINKSQEIIGLLADDPNVDLEEVDFFGTQIFSDDYIPETLDKVNAYICVDTDIPRTQNATTKEVTLYIYVFMHHDYMKLNPTKWIGQKGNRRDCLCNELTKLLNGSMDFGIGRFSLESALRFKPQMGYSGRTLKFEAKSFNQSR